MSCLFTKQISLIFPQFFPKFDMVQKISHIKDEKNTGRIFVSIKKTKKNIQPHAEECFCYQIDKNMDMRLKVCKYLSKQTNPN